MSIDFFLFYPFLWSNIFTRYMKVQPRDHRWMPMVISYSHCLTEVFWVPMLQWVGGPMTPLSCWSLLHHAGYPWSTNVTEINDVALGRIFLSLAFSQDSIEIGTWLLGLLWFGVCYDYDAFWRGWGHPKMIVELANFDWPFAKEYSNHPHLGSNWPADVSLWFHLRLIHTIHVIYLLNRFR